MHNQSIGAEIKLFCRFHCPAIIHSLSITNANALLSTVIGLQNK